MNNTIKFLIIILILNSSFLNQINAQEITITIPQKFNINEFPLPPFPEEIINKLEVIDYESDLLGIIKIREIELDNFEFNYYNEFLNNRIHKKSFLYHESKLGTDFESFYIGYNPEYYNNFYYISGNIEYDFGTQLVNLNAIYKEYRLPVSLNVLFDLQKQSLNFSLGQKDYFNEWYINPIISLNSSSISLYYNENRNIFPLVDLNFTSTTNNYGAVALGLDSFRLGVTILNLNPMPYFTFKKDFKNWGFLVDTNVNAELFDYNMNIIFRKDVYLGLGLGLTMSEDYNDFTPYLLFRENYLFGERTYKLSGSEFSFVCSFINDDLTSIILFNIQNINNFTLGLEMEYKEFGLGCNFEYKDDVEPTIGLFLTYKAG